MELLKIWVKINIVLKPFQTDLLDYSRCCVKLIGVPKGGSFNLIHDQFCIETHEDSEAISSYKSQREGFPIIY